ncbi:MAG: hypothetical protein ABH879_05645 [archaeon]
MSKISRIFKSVRIIIVLVFLVLAVVAIHPSPDATGATIRTVVQNSSASAAGMESPKPTTLPMSRERVLSVNNKAIGTIEDYYAFVETVRPQRAYTITTTKGIYKLEARPLTVTTVLNETEEKVISEVVEANETINGMTVPVNRTINRTVVVNKTRTDVVGVEDLGLKVYEAPKTNLRKGLDLQGGTRVILMPEEEISPQDKEMLLENMKYRLNVYGLSDVVVREAGDLSGNEYILVEIAGANEDEVKELLARQGKFEAKIGNDTVFRGGSDITYVCRSADCSGIDPSRGCSQASATEWFCRFRFAISLSPPAAQRQADLTRDLQVVTENEEQYLSEKLYLYLDNRLVDELNIGADLRGQATTEIAISGGGTGNSRDVAVFEALKNMKSLQTILITGSLPVKLNIVKTDSISPTLGDEFVKNAILVGLLAMLAVCIVVYIRYRRLNIAIPMMFTMISEVVLLVGLAALIGWNLDLAAIAGIIIAVGTGVDDQIVITDETLRKEASAVVGWKQRVKRAFFIIMAAYFTTVAAMIPLYYAGAGLLKGFAITTIFGVTFGVFITRPAYAKVIEILLND